MRQIGRYESAASLKPPVGQKTPVWPNDLHYRTVSTGLESIHTVKTILLSLPGASATATEWRTYRSNTFLCTPAYCLRGGTESAQLANLS